MRPRDALERLLSLWVASVRTDPLPDGAQRILLAYNRAELERMQATALRETALVTEAPAPSRRSHGSVYFGSPEEMRGIPAVGDGCGSGATGRSIPHVDGLK